MYEQYTPLENRKFEKGFMLFGAIASIIIGLGVLIFFIDKVGDSHSIPKDAQILNLTNFGAFGDFIAGVVGTFFSLAGFFLLYLTLKDQRENFHRERLESNFFEMIKFHRENVNEMEYSYYEDNNRLVTSVKRKVFKEIFVQFKEAWFELKHLFTKEDLKTIYLDSYYSQLAQNDTIQKRKIDLKQFAQIDIIYLIVFFGLSAEDRQTILNITHDKYNPAFIEKILNFASLKPQRESVYWDRWVTVNQLQNRIQIFTDILNIRINPNHTPEFPINWIQDDNKFYPFKTFYPDNYTKYYGGHQFRLGHYYRHIFQTVEFIDKEKYLSEKEKYNYIRILRGQLSNYEQIIFFLNSLSLLGRTWEIVKKDDSEQVIPEAKLITKYHLIKNVPAQYIVGEINLLGYYPEIKYESINLT